MLQLETGESMLFKTKDYQQVYFKFVSINYIPHLKRKMSTRF